MRSNSHEHHRRPANPDRKERWVASGPQAAQQNASAGAESGRGSHPGESFRVNDKIVDLKNGRYPDVEDQNEEHFVANGELAKAKDIKPGRMVVEVSDPKRQILIY